MVLGVFGDTNPVQAPNIMSNSGLITIKISVDTHGQLKALIDKIVREGWQHVGADRQDSPTIANVVAEAITALTTRKARLKDLLNRSAVK